MTATIVEIFEDLRESSNVGVCWHNLIEESDDHDCDPGNCNGGRGRFYTDPSQVPPFVWAGGAA